MYLLIKSIVQSIVDPDGKPFTFYHGPKELQNAQKKSNSPFIYMDAPLISNAPIKVGGLILDEYSPSFLIGYTSDIKWTYDKHVPFIRLARESADIFITKMINAKNTTTGIKTFASISGSTNKTDFVNVFDMNVTGVYLNGLKIAPAKPIQKIC